ncbi:NUDIX domain-containing protein [Sphingomonas sp. IC-11]|uniref:NUDIX hydrolase n=1 Tax=Sphingomonas sp. IC-11 TaxID=2898528 RepID=UPI001E4237D3|nr:NUDIX domain-containing protein [Sphingomonas sp. IC-11]MCD2314646.1 NUDIX domain-containing protein [Sphingomonas sp. IC-11]
MSDDLPEAIPAATLIIFREAANGPPELLMVERAKAMVFAGGAMVFPGGRIDPGDHVLAELNGGGDEMAARIAAVRETIEEAGLPIGLSSLPAAERLAQMRVALHGGATLAEALAEAEATLDLEQLVPWARWRPAHRNMRIFDTRFYLAELPRNAPHATVDRTENVRLVWATAQQVLADADAGKLEVIFPTRRNLERLAQFNSFAEAAAHAHETPIRTVTPWSETRNGEEHLCIPDDCGYPVTSEVIASAMRG